MLQIEGQLEETIKIKPLTKSQILISLDRLTRFKSTEDKYLRVFKDILTSNLISPKYRKNQLNAMDYRVLTDIVVQIFNFSLAFINNEVFHSEFATRDDLSYLINKNLLAYEKSIFKFDKQVQTLLENKIDYKKALTLLDSENLPLNLKWLKTLNNLQNQKQIRCELGIKFPIEKVVIVEGITEEILLPKLAKICGYDFDKLGITLISAGGKNQVVKLFYQYADILKLPMYVLLDNDAKDNYEEILPKLRKHDVIHVLKDGEFEDVLPLNLIKRTINKHFRNFSSISLDELRQDLPMTQILSEIFKQRGFEFKKAEFASLICENILSKNDVSEEIETFILKLAM